MYICLIWKILVYVLLCVFPVDIKGNTCECTHWSGRVCKSCGVGCFLVLNYFCYECQPNCYNCSSQKHCDVCQTGLYGPKCEYDCLSCRDGSCINKTCTHGCADGYYNHEDGGCRRCPKTCTTCNSIYDCTSCIAGHTDSYCQNCKPGFYQIYGQCNQCNTNCLHDTCSDNSGECKDGCKDGWTGWECNDTCGPNCVSCDRHIGTACTAGGGTKETNNSINIDVIVVAVGSSVVLIIVVVAAVLCSRFFRRRRLFMYRERYSFTNNVNYSEGDNRVDNTAGNTDGNTGDDGYSLADMSRIAHENVDKTSSAAHNTLPILTPLYGAAEIEEVLYGTIEGMPVIPFVNFEEICKGDVGDGDMKGLNSSNI